MENEAKNAGIPSSEKSAEADAGSELLPCPCCGGVGELTDCLSEDGDWQVWCLTCKLSTAACLTQQRAIQLWSARASTSQEKE